MAKTPNQSPSWCKWWMQDWYHSSLRRFVLKTAAQRGIYRELWDICMSSPDPGAAVDGCGNPISDSDLAQEIGCRKDHFGAVVRVLLEQGKITRGAQHELRLSQKATKKSLPDHWKYKRLRAKPSDSEQKNDAPRQRQRQSKKDKNPSSRRDEHAEGFKAAFEEFFEGQEYIWTTADFVQLAKFKKRERVPSPEQFVTIAKWHWGRGEYVPGTSLTIKGLCADWTSLAVKYNNRKGSPKGADPDAVNGF